jgi:hypothetical protein
MNEFLIGAQGEHLVFMRPVPQRITKDQAITLAAWLVLMADPGQSAFNAKIEHITSET